MDTKKWFIVTALATLAALFLIVPAGKKPKFLEDVKITPGIDLAGGADLTYQILYKDEAERRDQRKRPQVIIDVLRKRINQRGLKEPRLSTLGDDRIVIQLAVQRQEELDSYKKLLETVGSLKMMSVASKEIHQRWLDTPGTKEGGWAANAPAGYEAIPNDHKMTGEYDHLGFDYILVESKPVITGADVKTAREAQDPLKAGGGGWKVHFELTQDGGMEFDKAAKRLHSQRPLGIIAIILDDKIQSKPVIQTDRFGGSGEITGGFGKKEAENLAVILRSGQLPVAIGNGRGEIGKPESENFIGPTLAQDSMKRGIMAAVGAMLLVMVFMVGYYRAGGIVAFLTLVCNITYLLAIMAIFGATMTLPGLAGLALTVAMAVDNNILILERIREEMAKGKTALQAFEAGHNRAFSAILDGNVTTLLSAAVLYYFGTDAVQGFATVLAIGILTTMFSVLVVGKMLNKILIQGGVIREFKMMKLWTKFNTNWIRLMPAGAIVMTLLFVGGGAIFASRFKESLGMDFKGGVRVIFSLNQDQTIEYVRGKLDSIQGPDGRPLYPDAEVTAMGKPSSGATKVQVWRETKSNIFQVRSSTQDLDQLKAKLQEAFAGDLSHDPFGEPVFQEDSTVTFTVMEGGAAVDYPAGGWFDLYFQEYPEFNEAAVTETLKGFGSRVGLSVDSSSGVDQVNLVVKRVESPKGLIKLRIFFAKPDVATDGKKLPDKYVAFRALVEKSTDELKLAKSPFTAPGRIGPTAASDLRDSTIWALIVSWVVIIIYIAIRFSSWKFGLAAVVALVFDAVLAIGFVAFCGWIVPKTLGLSFEMNVTTVAAILTVIGYAVNDTVVVFDRIRENLVLMKKETFAEIVSTSVNQTMSRTILTGTSVLGTCVILYVMTMTSAGGVAEFALPMFMGVLAGTFGSIFIACMVALKLTGGKKPEVAK